MLNFLKCLSDETRLKIVLLVSQHDELCVCDIMTALNENQAKTSRHLAHLREHEMLISRREGKWMFYRINPALPQWRQNVLKLLSDNEHDFLANDQSNVMHLAQRTSSKNC